jgi:hypothetical protein
MPRIEKWRERLIALEFRSARRSLNGARSACQILTKSLLASAAAAVVIALLMALWSWL